MHAYGSRILPKPKTSYTQHLHKTMNNQLTYKTTSHVFFKSPYFLFRFQRIESFQFASFSEVISPKTNDHFQEVLSFLQIKKEM